MKSIQAWVLCCAMGLLAVVAGAVQAGPMQLSGQFDVSPTGAATYSIPLTVPPGTAGIEPKLSLVYNSQTGNGLLGVGWSLSGLSAITRCPRTIAQDGVRGGINYDNNDRYCLDGQRLMAINGSYGADGTEYRTERESFSKVIGYGSAGNGPAWFKVWTKAGQILEYGNTADSRIEAQGKSSVRVWAVSKISDTVGNYLTLSYTEDSANGDYVPNRIDYTGNASQSPSNSVQFLYELRPDSVPLYLAGSAITSSQRLKTLQTYAGTILTKEVRLSYGTGTTTNRSRIAGITECALPANVCKPTVTPTWTEYGSNAFNGGSTWGSLVAGYLSDVDGDGRTDFIAQQSDGIYVALSNGSGANASSQWIASFGSSQGYSDGNTTPLYLLDINADGLADVVGIASDGVYVALSNGSGFTSAAQWLGSSFGTNAGWSNLDTYPRTFADVNGDGRPDLVGFKNDGVYVSLNTGTSFAAATLWSSDFGTGSPVAYSTQSTYPRLVQDINGDGLADIVGFANGGTYVALNTGSGFAAATLWLSDFGVAAGYSTQDAAPRALADINGDGLPDVVGFKSDGTYVAINTGTGFQAPTRWIADFGSGTATAYGTQKGYPRYLADVNGDGKADIVGFAANGVQVSLSTGSGFGAPTQWVAGFGSGGGYSTSTPRQLADVDGDGFPDIVGTLSSGFSVATTARTTPADLATALADGMGTTTTITYLPLTNSAVYTKGFGAVYPQVELTPPFYVVAATLMPNALGNGYAPVGYKYGGLRVDLTGRGMLGFGWGQSTQMETYISRRTDYRQDWPYTGLPRQVERFSPGYGSNGLLGLMRNSYGCLNPQSSANCTVAAGNQYFPYVSQTTEANWEDSGIALPVTTTTTTYDLYGNATQIGTVSSDGLSKTTTNTYVNDVANWRLGRLTRALVAGDVGAAVPAMSNGVFVFTQTISSDTLNYNLRNAAIAAGWDQVSPLQVTVTIAPGVYVGSNSTSGYAFDTGADFPTGSTLALINNGNIHGMGGLAGSAGGPALRVRYPISITNNGVIGGGGGGGAKGANGWYYAWADVDSRCAYTPDTLQGGQGGQGGQGQGYSGPKTGGGSGSAGQSLPSNYWWCGPASAAGNGYPGGGIGIQGGGNGGPAGAAITGNGLIVWVSTGNRYGALDTPDVSATTTPTGQPFHFVESVSTDRLDYNLRNAAILAGWNQISPLRATVMIVSGVYVGSSSTSGYAFDTGTDFPTGSTLTLINNGNIHGLGGLAGAAGGPALRARHPISITNNGVIGGGGGGGAKGANGWYYAWTDVDSRCAYTPDTLQGGQGGQGQGYSGPKTGGGAGSAGQSLPSNYWWCGPASAAGNGYPGGGLGTQGGGNGGLAGAAITGNTNVNWIVIGTRYGALN